MMQCETWWRARSLRERWMLGLMAALAVAVLGWLLVLRPLEAALAAATQRHERAVVASARLNAMAGMLGQAPMHTASRSSESVAVLIGKRASEAGLELVHIRAQGANRASIAIAAVRPPAFFGWIQSLERLDRLHVEHLVATRNADATIAVEATLRRSVA